MSLKIHANEVPGRSNARGGASLGASSPLAFNDGMIQSTTRLSRGARLRRPRPVGIYGVMVIAGVVLFGLGLLVFRH